MAIIKSSVEIDAPIDRVFELAQDVESFPQFMPDLKSVTVLERSEDGRRTVTEWVGIVKEFKTTVKWTEEDIWDDQAHTCTFTLVKGDYAEYSGNWQFIDLGGRTRFDSEMKIEYEVPLIGALIKGIILKKIQDNVDNMLAAIKRKAEDSAAFLQDSSSS